LAAVVTGATTVLTLCGTFNRPASMPSMIKGEVCLGNRVVPVVYNNWGLLLSTVKNAAAVLDTAIRGATPPVVVFGYDLGAVAANYWLNNYAAGSGVLTTDLSFTLIGDPVNRYGGYLGTNGWGLFKDYFGTSVYCPAATPYTVRNYIRQYDGFADWPTGTMNPDAQANAKEGQSLIHPAYQDVDLKDLITVTPTVGGSPGHITYGWWGTYPVPLLGTVWNSEIEALDTPLRTIIETAYDRPVVIPPMPPVPPFVLPYTLGAP
jgi:hypothetical protein